MKTTEPIILKKNLTPGLYRVNVDGDGHDFHWEDLYTVLNIYGNKNQRTGPWDFDLLNHNRPVLPSYWVYLNNRKIGLWYFNRPSAAQVKAKRFKGEGSFWIKEAGDYEFRFEPYRPFNLTWTQVDFAVDPDDRLLDRATLKPEAQFGFQRLLDQARWDKLANRLEDAAFPYRALLTESLDWAKKMAMERGSTALSLFVATYRLRQA